MSWPQFKGAYYPFRVWQYAALGIMTLVITFLLGYGLPTRWNYRPQTDCRYPIAVSSINQFHAELILPVTTDAFDWRSHLNLAQLGSGANAYRYLSFGWGDRTFFMDSSFDPISIFDALFLPGPTVLHVWGHQELPQPSSVVEMKQLRLSRAQYLKLNAFIAAGFQRNTSGTPYYIRPGLYRNSGFYEAVGTYSIVRTCNNWIADALRVVDINTPLWAALAPAVMGQLKNDCSTANS